MFGAVIGVACLAWGGAANRFGAPLAILFVAYWSASNATLYTSFYATAALVNPLFLLGALVDQRQMLRDAARTTMQICTFLATMAYIILGEGASLYAVARCDPAKLCVLRGGIAFDGISALVVGGLAGGLAQLLVASVLSADKT